MSDEDRNENQDSPAPQEESAPAEVEYEYEGPEMHLDDEFSEPEDYTPPPEKQKLGPDPEVERLRREHAEMAEKYGQVEHFLPLFAREDFREWLETRAELGDEDVPHAPAPTEADIIETRLIKASPEFAQIHEAVLEYVATLPPFMQPEHDENHAVYNATFKKLAAIAAGRLPAPAPPPAAYPTPSRDIESFEASIRAKEVIKEQAQVEPPGPAHYEVPKDPMAGYRKARERLFEARKYGTPREREEAELRMVEAYFDRGEDKKKPNRGTNW